MASIGKKIPITCSVLQSLYIQIFQSQFQLLFFTNEKGESITILR